MSTSAGAMLAYSFAFTTSASVVQELESLFQVSSLDQFADKLQRADKLFRETLTEIEAE